MKLYRVKDTSTGKFYRHHYGLHRGGDWVDVDFATIWTKPGGANGALGAVRESGHKTVVIETAIIDHYSLEWK